MSEGAQYLRLVLVDLHGSAHRCLNIVPLGLRSVEYLHRMGPSGNLEMEDGQTEKMISFCSARNAGEDRGIENNATLGFGD